MSRKQGTEEPMEREPQAEETSAEGAAGESADAAGGLQGELEALRAERDEWKDRALRTAAESENYRRRARLDADEQRKYANERLISEILPVLDNFTRALEAAEATDNIEALKEGVQATHRQLADALNRAGLSRIEAVGQPFDPNHHEAIMQVAPGDGQEPNQVVEELRAGYKLHDRVVRPSLVKVTSA